MRSLLPFLLLVLCCILAVNFSTAQETTHRSRADKGHSSSGFTAVGSTDQSSTGPAAKLKHRARSDKGHFPQLQTAALSPAEYRRRFRNRFNPVDLAEEGTSAKPVLQPADYNHKLNAHRRRKVVIDIFGGRA